MRIAIVHDYLREYGGAERVLEALHEIWPEAPLYTSFVDWKSLGSHAERFRGWDIRTSWVQHNPIVKRLHSPLRFLAPRVWESFDVSSFDVVLTSSGWFICRGVKAGRRRPINETAGNEGKHMVQDINQNRPLQICYIHHPPRNLYGYATGGLWQRYLPVRIYTALINFFMRHYDYNTAQRVDYFIANSKETARRVEKFYRRESTVIYPPITVTSEQLTVNRKKKIYYLSAGRLMWSKRVDLAIQAANKLHIPLKIVGTGPEEENLRAIAGPTVEFMGNVSDEELDRLYKGAKALIFSALDEDFGMVPVEAMAVGTPVIALSQGGVTETVRDNVTGVLFREPTVLSLVAALKTFVRMRIAPRACITQAKKFNKDRFTREIRMFVARHSNTNQ